MVTRFSKYTKVKMWDTVLVLCGLLHTLMHLVCAQDSCITPDSQPGICINIKTCQPLLNLLLYHHDTEADFLQQSQCGYENFDPKVCCPQNGQENNRSAFPNVLIPPQCGIINLTYSRVTGGTSAELDTYPWMAALGYTNKANPDKPKFLCGGALISDRHVLTAAHCVFGRNNLYLVRLGDLDLIRDDDGAHPINVLIAKKTVHPEYRERTYVNDIAVLTLRNTVQFTDSIRPICLPAASSIRNKNITGRYSVIAGWGRLARRLPTSDRLMEVQVPIVSTESCKWSYRNFKSAVINERVVCAGFPEGGKDACEGDSGGPLMLPEGKTFYVVGVVSYGYDCAKPNFPGVYTRVTQFLDFISEAMN